MIISWEILFKSPFRKLPIEQTKEILNLLKNSKISIVQIAADYNISRNTVYKINKGETCVIKGFNYPAR